MLLPFVGVALTGVWLLRSLDISRVGRYAGGSPQQQAHFSGLSAKSGGALWHGSYPGLVRFVEGSAWLRRLQVSPLRDDVAPVEMTEGGGGRWQCELA